MVSREPNDEWCDARDDNSSTEASKKINNKFGEIASASPRKNDK